MATFSGGGFSGGDPPRTPTKPTKPAAKNSRYCFICDKGALSTHYVSLLPSTQNFSAGGRKPDAKKKTQLLDTLRSILGTTIDSSATWGYICNSCRKKAEKISEMDSNDRKCITSRNMFVNSYKETKEKHRLPRTPSGRHPLDRHKRMSTETPKARGPRKRVLIPFSPIIDVENVQPVWPDENVQPVCPDDVLAAALDYEDLDDDANKNRSCDVKVEIFVHYPSKTRHRVLQGPWKSVARALCHGDEDAALQQVLHMPNAQQEARLLVAQEVEEESKRICAKPSKGTNISVFRENSPAAMDRWSYDNQKAEMELKCPILLTILEAAAMNKTQLRHNKCKTEESLVPGLMTAASILFNCRAQEMTAHQTMTGLQLKRSGADQKCFDRMNRKKLSVVHSVVKTVQQQYGKNHDSKVISWASQMMTEQQNIRLFQEHLDDLTEQATSTTASTFTAHIASTALTIISPRLQKELQSLITNRHPGFRLIGDNVDLKVKPRYMSTVKQNVDHHHFQYIAVKNRVSGMHLPDDRPVADAESISLMELQPNAIDNRDLHLEWSVLTGRIISQHLPKLSWMKSCLPSLTHEHMDSMKKKSEVINMGVIMKNENTKEGIQDIMEDMQRYAPTDVLGNTMMIVSGGDLLTCEREVNAQEDQRDGWTPTGRFEGLQPVIEDFHTLGNFYQAIWKELYHHLSAGDIGTLMSARNILQAKDVTKDPMKNLNAAKHFLDKYTAGLVIAAAMEFFGMTKHTDQPTKHNFHQLDQTQEKVMEVLGTFINEFAIPSDEEFRASQSTPLKCPHCGNSFNLIRTLQTHVRKRHSRIEVRDVLGGGQQQKAPDNDSVFNYSCNALSMCLLALDFDDARKKGDGPRIIRLHKFLMLHFKVTNKYKYANHTFRHISQVKCLLSPRLAYEVTWNRSVNTKGKSDSNVEHDRKVEHDNRTYKGNVRGFHGKITENSVQRVSRSAQKIEVALKCVDKQMSLKTSSGKHDTPDESADILTLADRFHSEEIFKVKKGRHHHFFPDFPRSILSRLDIDNLHDWMKSALEGLCEKNIFKCINK